ncbi:hypothetical protein AB0H69_40170 [Streptomyces phaeochromogenes]|uniref:hypothetical protein n=1 Tax=Streptomyces phaeochromogenes TaxID=1923 RepID=UPI0033C63378
MGMSKNTLRSSLITALAVGMLPLLAACGGGSGDEDSGKSGSSAAGGGTKNVDGAAQLNIPEGVNAEAKKEYIRENAIAACMKKEGFTYTPHVATAPSADVNTDGDGEDYAAAKKYRQKYGFGTYAAAAYPDDPDVPFSNAGGKVGGKTLDPVDDDTKGLTPAQVKAYEAALYGPPAKTKAEEKDAGCTLEGNTAAYGPPLSAAAEKKKQNARTEENRQNGLALNGDTQLVQLAQQYATCLKGQGIPVSTTQPTGMAYMVRIDLAGKLPEDGSKLTKEQAMPLLTADIDIALKDLECGKKFRAAYFPKEKANPYWGDGA